MFGFLTPAHRGDPGPLANADAADKYWQLLPRSDPVAAQRAISEALADLVVLRDPGRDQLGALLQLDHRARPLRNALLVNYTTVNAQSRPLEKRYWRSAIDLSQSFATAFAHFLQQIRDEPNPRIWREYAPRATLRLFKHRQVEFLLRPLMNASSNPEGWGDLHEAYRYAQATGFLRQPVTVPGSGEEPGRGGTLEHQYIRVLLLEVMNDGQFSPYDAFWLSRFMPRWCEAVSLRTDAGDGGGMHGDHFVVDLDSAEGLKRATPTNSDTVLALDPSPLLALIVAEIESLRDPPYRTSVPSSFGRARQVRLLRKVAAAYTTTPEHMSRRGERKALTSTVKVIVGFGPIMRMLRHEEKRKVAARGVPVPEVEEITITVQGGYSQSADGDTRPAEWSNEPPTTYEFGVPHQVWQLKDRSASGCRLRAPVGDVGRVHPGALAAILDDETMRWSLVVVRRIRTRIGDRVDIGAEYVGQSPRGVTMAIAADDPSSPAAPVANGRDRFTALYLRESTKQPVMPFKSLIVAPVGRTCGRSLTLRSTTAEYSVRLKEPIEEQDDFVWLPYEVLGRRPIVQPAPEPLASGATPLRSPAVSRSLDPGQEGLTDWLALPPARAAGESA
jgi:hypothetical protein